VILTTHYLEEAEKYADRIGLMHEGVLNREGTMRELVAGHPSRLSFVVPPGAALPLAVTETVNQLAVIETDDLQRDLTILLRWADDTGVRLDQLSANPSSLDDLFRSVTRG
jgi:ABC-2 type transport system ATP-binding protein